MICGTLFLTYQPDLRLNKILAILVSADMVIYSIDLIEYLCLNDYDFQAILIFPTGLDYLGLNFCLGLDGLSLFFYCLSNFLIFLCFIFIWDEQHFKTYAINLFFVNFFLLLVFASLNIFIFYIFFEAILIPMFFIILLWGSRERRIRAVYLLFFYTLVGSLFMLIALLYIYLITGTLNFDTVVTFDFTLEEQYWLWLGFFLSFASKIPLFPFHIWLPEAHVEAPTVGSVLLAGILLKLGVYGFLRFSLTLFPQASLFFAPLIYVLSITGILYASFAAMRQVDLKRIIAYSSIAHMNLVTLGIFSLTILGFDGALLQSISHGFVASGLFLIIGILYSRYHSRFLVYYSGLVHFMPIFAIYFLILTLANIAIPGTSSFVGEFLILCSLSGISFFSCMLAALGVILCGGYSLWLYNRIIFGNLKIKYIKMFADVNFYEFLILTPLIFFVFILGIYPTFLLEYFSFPTLKLFLLFI